MAQRGHNTRMDAGASDDDYIKSNAEEERLGLPGGEPAEEMAREGDFDLSAEKAADAADILRTLDWIGGLTRDEIRLQYHELPLAIYLRLPDSKRFISADEVLRDAGFAENRSEGDFLGPDPDFPERASVEDGGPPGWGGDPEFSIGGIEDGGSAEDTEGLLPGDEPGQEPASE
jgi:hypothetical protein